MLDNQAAMLTYNQLHDLLGHPNETVVKATAKKYNFPLSGQFNPCEHCAKGKMRKHNIPKEATSKATKLGERISFDISSVNVNSHGGNKFWLLIIDEFTSYCWSIFLKRKSDLSQAMMDWTNNFERECGIDIGTFRCDNSGENKAF
jgi:hypothetical protein